jgi:putative cardiolipin synthase
MFPRTLGLLAASLVSFQVMAAEMNLSTDGTFVYKSTDPQEMTIINSGSASLKKRLQMIEGAQRTIEAEFFIYNIDQAGRLFTQALVKKAGQGVKVRILVDYGFPIGKLDPYYATALAKAGVEVRYYNPNLSFELFKGQFRSHRKTLIVDDSEAMTGGRNIADEYFDLAADYNFLDRDVSVKGPMAKAVRASFDRFWNSNMTKTPEKTVLPEKSQYGLGDYVGGGDEQAVFQRYKNDLNRYQKETARANDYLTQNDKDRSVLKNLKAMNTGSLQSHTCMDSVFAADMPGIGQKSRVLFEEIKYQVLQAHESIDVESPYFVLSPEGMETFKLLQKRAQLNVYTNSLNSTDAIYTTAVFYPNISQLIQLGMNVYIYHGKSLNGHDTLLKEAQDARWGIHAKSAVIDKETIMVGTFNVDPRSHNINAEMAIMCRNNKALAKDVLDSMEERKGQSVQLNTAGRPVDGTSKFENVSLPKRITYHLLTPFANIFSFLL